MEIPILYLPHKLSKIIDAPRTIIKRSSQSDIDMPIFRWIIGHQLLAQHLKLATYGIKFINDSESTHSIINYVKSFSIIMNYIVSWSPETYLKKIRPEMMKIHPAFSAIWWHEIKEFKDAMIKFSQKNKFQYEKIAVEFKKFWKAHEAVRKYTNLSKSLHREKYDTLEPEKNYSDYFDIFFRIVRKDEFESSFLSQLKDRVDIISKDVYSNGLYDQSPLGKITVENFIGQLNEVFNTASSQSIQHCKSECSFDHIAIQVKDINETVSWYKEFFYAEIAWKMKGGFSATTLTRLPTIQNLVELKVGTVKFHIFDSSLDSLDVLLNQPKFQHFGIKIAERQRFHEMHQNWSQMMNSGKYRSFSKSSITEIIQEEDNCQIFYCTDPNGLEFEVIWQG